MENKKISLSTYIGQKIGMTRVFDKDGSQIAVTVVRLIPNYISQVKTKEKDSYSAYQVAYCEKKEKHLNRPVKGHLKRAGIEKHLVRFYEVLPREGINCSEENLGREISLDLFVPGTFIDVTGTSKGKGFQGVIKRHNFSGGPMAHGSHFHRHTGSIGNRATPARVFAEKKMPGQLGSEQVTTQNLKVVEINKEKGFMLIKGAIPGSNNSFIKISKAVKKK